jgi:hypothetical protein
VRPAGARPPRGAVDPLVRRGALAAVLAALLGAAGTARAQGVPSRLWRPEERLVLPDLSRVGAVAVTQSYVFAATREALAVYDRASLALRDVLVGADGFPGAPVATMVADPSDDTAWMGGPGFWAAYHPFGRRWESGPLPGAADLVALDGRDVAGGAYFHTGAGWYLVRRGALSAEAVPAGPPLGERRLAPTSPRELWAAAPGLDAVRLSIERDPMLRTTPITSAALAPIRGEAYLGTDGNGVFRVDLFSYRYDRLPAGLLGSAAGAVAAEPGLICAAADVRRDPLARGVTCFAPDLSDFTYLRGGLAGLPGTQVRRMLLTRDAVWLATNAGAVRLPRHGGAPRQFTERDGLQSGDVRALARAPGGIWVGSAFGVAVAPDGARADAATPGAAVDASVLALAVTGDTLWIGSSLGLLVLPPGATAPVAVPQDLPSLRSPVVALAVKGDTILAVLPRRLAVRAGGVWRIVDPPGVPIGPFTSAAPDPSGFWLGGAQGLAFYQPASNVWRALTSTGDLPLPVLDVAASGDYAWAATPGGVVRLLRLVLVP